MLTPVRSAQFKRDVRRLAKRGRELGKLRQLLGTLIDQARMTAKVRDHRLRGIWKGYREVHVEPDRVLIYRIEGDELHLIRTGSHADLFRE